MGRPEQRLKIQIFMSVLVLSALMGIIGTMFTSQAYAQSKHEEQTAVIEHKSEAGTSSGLKYGLIAASIAFGLGAISAGYAISHVGAAAMGAIAEKPEIAGQALIFVALAEGIVVFGFITALMILGKV
jgi:V/A-type H+/Na+-transporting ATPase subunit K